MLATCGQRQLPWCCDQMAKACIAPLDIHDPCRVVESCEGWMALPVTEPLVHWPVGDQRHGHRGCAGRGM